jgi:hypothetical protein
LRRDRVNEPHGLTRDRDVTHGDDRETRALVCVRERGEHGFPDPAFGPVAAGWDEVERAVWPVLVVVAAVDAEDMLEVAPAEDEDPVEAVSADRAHPTLGVGVRVRGLDGRADDRDALGAKDLVEGVAELCVAIVD